jgi:hypothetical protein
MERELHERLERLNVMCEQMVEAVRQLEEVEAESRIRRRDKVLEDRVDALENSGE